jgi:hypothetical protein
MENNLVDITCWEDQPRVIPTKNGRQVLVDAQDYPELSAKRWRWYGGYAVTGKGATKMHRLIMKPERECDVVDHVNGDVSDNRRANLRVVTSQQNSMNRRKFTGKSKYKGVHWKKANEKWEVKIKKDGKTKYIGLFDNEEEAANAYDREAIALFGEFARLNNIHQKAVYVNGVPVAGRG